MEISDEVYINSMNDISKHFQIMLDNKDKKIADLQLQLDQVKSEITKHKILLNDMETENNHLETMLDQANERLNGAIVPKFKIGQEVFVVNTDYYYKKDYKVEKHKIVGIEDKVDRKNTYVRWYSLEFKDCPTSYSKRYKFLEKNVFATETEAEKKLQELRGGE